MSLSGFMPGIVLLENNNNILFQNQNDQLEREVDILHLKQRLKAFINNSSHLLKEYFAPILTWRGKYE